MSEKEMPNYNNDKLFGKTNDEYIGLNPNSKDRKANVLVIGGNSTGKMFKYIKPTIPSESVGTVECDFFTGRTLTEQEKQDFEKDMSILAKMNEIILKAVHEWYRVNYSVDDEIHMAKGDNIAKLRCNRLITLERFFLNELCYAEDASQMIKQIELLGCGEWQQIDGDILRKWRNKEYSAMESLERYSYE